MHIDPKTGAGLNPLFPLNSEKTARPERPTAASNVGGTAYYPTAVLSTLMAHLHRLPETRDELVRQVRDRLLNGDLLTSSAAVETASAILGSEVSSH